MTQVPTMSYSPGLEGVIAAQTTLSTIDGHVGKFIYRGYDTTQLAESCSFEDVWLLMMADADSANLPTDAEIISLYETAYDALKLPPVALDVIRGLPADVPIMTALRTVLSTTYAAWGMQPTIDLSSDQIRQDCFRAAAATPAAVGAIHRLGQGLEPITPHKGDTWPVNYLRMVTGEAPTEAQAMAITRYMILVADHGLNASTFVARSVASTATDVGSAVVAAIGALAGPLHGGAPSRVLEMFDEIGTADHAEAWVTEKINAKAKIMGFGHRVYKTYDPRARVLKATAKAMNAPLADYAEQVEDTIIRTFGVLKPGRDIFTNVEYWSAVVLDAAGLPSDLFTPTFVAARMIGWTAHINEQLADNRIMRPRAEYVGPALRSLS